MYCCRPTHMMNKLFFKFCHHTQLQTHDSSTLDIVTQTPYSCLQEPLENLISIINLGMASWLQPWSTLWLQQRCNRIDFFSFETMGGGYDFLSKTCLLGLYVASLIKITKTHLYSKHNKITLDQQLNLQFSIDWGCTNILETSFSSTDLRSLCRTYKLHIKNLTRLNMFVFSF